VAEEGLFGDAKTVLFQSDHVTVSQRAMLGERFEGIDWQPATHLVTEYVGSKEGGEIAKIRAAQAITDEVFTYLLDFLAPGMTEKDVAAEIVYQHLKRGASTMSFDPIVAGGPNGSLPHARPSSRPLAEGELVVIDMGCFLDGYASDMTRTVALGDPGDEARRGYEVVLRAQEKAIAAAHAGMTGKELDAVARAVIDEAGLGDYFSHGLGHGLGLQIHEWPRLSYHVEHDLPPGACVTVEPGVYVPEQYGVRIEDILALTPDGCENLTNSPKHLISL
jgi:Xaa-Pro aminopeptidase